MSEPASETGGVLVQIVVGIIFALTAILIAATWYRIRRDARRSTHGLWLVASLTMIWISMTALAAMVAPESSISVLIAVLPMLVVVLGLAASALLLVANTPIVVRREGLRMATLVPAALGLTIVVTLALGWWWLFSAGYAHWRMGALPLGIIPGAIIIAELVAYTAYAFVYPSVHGRIGESEVIVVLGAGLSGDRVTPLLAGRLDRAVRVYDDLVAAGRRPWIVVSGGKGSDEVVSEAAAVGLPPGVRRHRGSLPQTESAHLGRHFRVVVGPLLRRTDHQLARRTRRRRAGAGTAGRAGGHHRPTGRDRSRWDHEPMIGLRRRPNQQIVTLGETIC